jgi:hypothetical protein
MTRLPRASGQHSAQWSANYAIQSAQVVALTMAQELPPQRGL